MTMTELHNALDDVADTFYLWAPAGTATPYIVFQWDTMPNISADDHVYQKVAAVTVQCYFTSFDMLNALDEVLDALVGFYTSSTAYDSDADVYIKTYNMEVIEDEQN